MLRHFNLILCQLQQCIYFVHYTACSLLHYCNHISINSTLIIACLPSMFSFHFLSQTVGRNLLSLLRSKMKILITYYCNHISINGTLMIAFLPSILSLFLILPLLPATRYWQKFIIIVAQQNGTNNNMLYKAYIVNISQCAFCWSPNKMTFPG